MTAVWGIDTTDSDWTLLLMVQYSFMTRDGEIIEAYSYKMMDKMSMRLSKSFYVNNPTLPSTVNKQPTQCYNVCPHTTIMLTILISFK